jgi:hypothetical protein
MIFYIRDSLRIFRAEFILPLTYEQLRVLKTAVVGDVVPCSVVEGNRRFRGSYSLNYEGEFLSPSASFETF